MPRSFSNRSLKTFTAYSSCPLPIQNFQNIFVRWFGSARVWSDTQATAVTLRYEPEITVIKRDF